MKRVRTSKGMVIGEQHVKAHDVTNPFDHRPAPIQSRGKVYRADKVTGAMKLDTLVYILDDEPTPDFGVNGDLAFISARGYFDETFDETFE